jgi:tRNA-Thr(GGU) m(6)t(6)A37 methyltransferase TsaA
MDIVLHPVGFVYSSEHSSEHGSRENYWGNIVSEICLDETKFTSEALEGLAEFSHVEVLFYLNGVSEDSVASGRRHPRSNPNWPQVGMFAQRGKARPNRIAATVCRLLSVEGLTLKVQGLDAFDGSPVLDIKPVFAEFTPDRAAIRQPKWSHELMANYFTSGEREGKKD